MINMYDAKEIDDNGFEEINTLNSNCLCDRSYYYKQMFIIIMGGKNK
jgi:hypothetical protein